MATTAKHSNAKRAIALLERITTAIQVAEGERLVTLARRWCLVFACVRRAAL